MPEEDFFQPLGSAGTDRIRIDFNRDRRSILTFTVQYETVIGDQFRPVIRFDNAHDQPHRDILDRSGQLVRKEWLAEMDNNSAMTYAIRDIKDNWRSYRRRFTRARS